MFAVLHVANFPLHAVLRTECGMTDRPAALFSGAGRKSIVTATTPPARAAGVEPGMNAPQAVARCPDLHIRGPNAAAEAEARAVLLATAFTVSPMIEDTAPGICTCDVTGLAAAQREAAARRAVSALHALGLPATAGLAPTPLLALYAARAADPGLACPAHPAPSGEPFAVAEPDPAEGVSTRPPRASPGLVLHVTDAPAFLATLPLSAIDPPLELAAVLRSWGLRTLGNLTALPRDEIIRRFGTEGLALWQRATGGSARPLRPVPPPRSFSAQLEFEDAVETLEPLLFILRRFLERLALELHTSQHVAAELHLALRLEDDTRHARSFRLPEPTADVEILFRALHTHLESLTTAASIAAVTLSITPARPLVRQQGLFETGLRDPHGFAETLARVSALVGPDRVGTPRPLDTHRPDAVRLATAAGVVPPPAEPPMHPPAGVPLRRWRPPLPARLNELDGVTYLWTAAVCGEIRQRSLPYPTNGDWWQSDQAWSRIEWDILLAEGGCYRLLRIGDDHFIEGEYD